MVYSKLYTYAGVCIELGKSKNDLVGRACK
jgi:hypothetical protein